MIAAITSQHQRLLQTVYDAFKQTGEWPRLQYVQTTLHHDCGIDLATVVASLPDGLTTLSPGWINPQMEVALTVAGVARCTGAEDDLSIFWRLLQRAVEEDRRFRPSPTSLDTPKLRTADLANEWGVPNSIFVRVGKLLAFEPWAYMSKQLSASDWELMISPTIRQFDSANSLGEYLDKRAAFFRPKRVGRILPAPPPPESGGAVHINITGGTIGTLNTGQVMGDIESHVNAVSGASASKFREAVKAFAEAVDQDAKLGAAARVEILEDLDYLVEEARKQPAERRPTLLRRTIEGLPGALTLAEQAKTAWDAFGPIIAGFLRH